MADVVSHNKVSSVFHRLALTTRLPVHDIMDMQYSMVSLSRGNEEHMKLRGLLCIAITALLAACMGIQVSSTTAFAEQEENGSTSFTEPSANEVTSPSPANGSPVYVNGSTGDDANPGTAELPVKTFAKAKALMEANDADTIYVTGAIALSGTSETWDLGGKTLEREATYTGELVHVDRGATLTLENIVIDGSSGSGSTGKATAIDGSGGSLVGAFNGSTVTVGNGAILQNNSIQSNGHWYPEGGGAVFANGSIVNIEGGTIRNNSAVQGGGIYGIYDSTINMSSGTIEGNRAIEGNSATLGDEYGGSGGGICAANGSDVNFSGGTITDNSAFERGGGISMGTYYASEKDSPVLTMTGGTISNNTAGGGGGGIFVQAGYSAEGNDGTPTYSIAHITAGDITGNSVTATGNGSAMFGGGGIYVNGYSSAYSAFHNGELYLSNVEVSGNSASTAGGGYAACPVSVTEISLTNGAAFYGNTTDEGNAREIYILAATYLGTHSGNPPYEISPSMLGGGTYKWVYDDGTEVPLDQLKGILSAIDNQSLSLSNDLGTGSPNVQKALTLSRVHITGNTSVTRGGGIGSNGSVFIGKHVDTTEIPVTKAWEDENDKDGLRPKSIGVNLYRDGEYVGYQTVTPDSNGVWTATFANLPKDDAEGHEYSYTVEERAVDGYTSKIAGDATTGFTITNTRETVPQEPPSEGPTTPEVPTTPQAPKDETPASPKIPDTSDASMDVTGLLVIAAIGCALLCVAAIVRRRNSRK